jgi:DNA replicative helicase MCM subunit Mcm2 (Cdc46/Mcm family)
MANAAIDAPVVPILLVGDGEVGKSAFLSYVDRCSIER